MSEEATHVHYSSSFEIYTIPYFSIFNKVALCEKSCYEDGCIHASNR